ncbi:MAG: acetoin utilization protein AcuC [Alphaproteobacteria bacterium]|nr:acetoin utilization protein AcuC [Alphaproteobacteria bacterium]
MLPRPVLIASEIYRQSRYGSNHPLGIPRVSAALDLIRALGWIDPADYVDSPVATPAQLARFHDPDYVAAVMATEAAQRIDEETGRRHNIGRNGNPIFGEVFRRPATACGASLKAADLLRAGGIVHSPAGGTHHGRRDQASGFCYFNDPVLAILAFLDQGLSRVAYVDVDAHHGDGVEIAFAGDRRVLTISVHEEGRWPYTGRIEDRAGGSARNLPVPAGFNDSEMDHLREHAIVPLVRGFVPDAVVLQCGADALADDPMSRLELSNNALWRVVRAMIGLAPRLLVLGGGGYNPWSVARCWAGVWGTLTGRTPPARLPEGAEAMLRGLYWNRRRSEPRPEHWFTTLADAPHDGPVRDAVRRAADAALEHEPAVTA